MLLPRVVLPPPRGSSEARGARAQRPGPPGHRSFGDEVERRDDPQLLPLPFCGYRGGRADRLRRRRPDGLRDGPEPGSRRPRGAALRPFALARAGPSRDPGALDRGGGRRRRSGVLLRDRLGRRARRRRRGARGLGAAAGPGRDEHDRPRRRARVGRRLRPARRRLPRLSRERRPPGSRCRDAGHHVRRRRRRLALAAPALDAMGDPERRTHCGPVGLGLVAKLVNNLLAAVIAAGTAEALGAGQRAGLDPGLAREVVMGATGDSWQLHNLFPRALAGDHRPGFTTRNLLKDLGYAADLADRPLPLGDVARELLKPSSVLISVACRNE